MDIVDGLVFDDAGGGSVVFNYRTWVEMLCAVICAYAGKSRQESELLVASSAVVKNAAASHMSVVLCSHELEYHWAMLIAHGENYWAHGIEPTEPDGYVEWERAYRRRNGLADESFLYIDA